MQPRPKRLMLLLRHPSYSHKNSEQLFREWNEVDFPKLILGFGFGKSVPRNERNNCQLLLKGAVTQSDFFKNRIESVSLKIRREKKPQNRRESSLQPPHIFDPFLLPDDLQPRPKHF